MRRGDGEEAIFDARAGRDATPVRIDGYARVEMTERAVDVDSALVEEGRIREQAGRVINTILINLSIQLLNFSQVVVVEAFRKSTGGRCDSCGEVGLLKQESGRSKT